MWETFLNPSRWTGCFLFIVRFPWYGLRDSASLKRLKRLKSTVRHTVNVETGYTCSATKKNIYIYTHLCTIFFVPIVFVSFLQSLYPVLERVSIYSLIMVNIFRFVSFFSVPYIWLRFVIFSRWEMNAVNSHQLISIKRAVVGSNTNQRSTPSKYVHIFDSNHSSVMMLMFHSDWLDFVQSISYNVYKRNMRMNSNHYNQE